MKIFFLVRQQLGFKAPSCWSYMVEFDICFWLSFSRKSLDDIHSLFCQNSRHHRLRDPPTPFLRLFDSFHHAIFVSNNIICNPEKENTILGGQKLMSQSSISRERLKILKRTQRLISRNLLMSYILAYLGSQKLLFLTLTFDI